MNSRIMETRRRAGFAYLMITPGILILLVFTFYPIFYGIPLAFTNYSVIGETKWIGWDNFERAFKDDVFLLSLKNSLLYLIVVPIIQILSILMAVLVNTKIKGVNFFRVSYFVPVVTSMVAVGITWKWLYQENGILNNMLKSMGIISESISFLTSSSMAIYSIMFVTVWKALGYYMMIYLAGLQSVPSDLQEAAAIDGANRWQIIGKITIPLLMPYVLLCSIMSMMGAVRVFDEVFVMTKEGGPANSTMVSGLYTYLRAFKHFEFGYSAAMGLIVALIIFLFTVLTFKFTKKGGNGYE